jgi:hypothetical protein
MEKIITLECPKCHCSVRPQKEWFQCGFCGTFLKLIEEDDGQQYVDMGVISGDRVHRVSRDLVHVIENESELIRSTLIEQNSANSDALMRSANVNYLLYLAQKKQGLEREISELTSKGSDLEVVKQLEKSKQELTNVVISIEDYECMVDPGRAGRKAREAKQKQLEAETRARTELEQQKMKMTGWIVVAAAALIIVIILSATH